MGFAKPIIWIVILESLSNSNIAHPLNQANVLPSYKPSPGFRPEQQPESEDDKTYLIPLMYDHIESVGSLPADVELVPMENTGNNNKGPAVFSLVADDIENSEFVVPYVDTPSNTQPIMTYHHHYGSHRPGNARPPHYPTPEIPVWTIPPDVEIYPHHHPHQPSRPIPPSRPWYPPAIPFYRSVPKTKETEEKLAKDPTIPAVSTLMPLLDKNSTFDNSSKQQSLFDNRSVDTKFESTQRINNRMTERNSRREREPEVDLSSSSQLGNSEVFNYFLWLHQLEDAIQSQAENENKEKNYDEILGTSPTLAESLPATLVGKNGSHPIGNPVDPTEGTEGENKGPMIFSLSSQYSDRNPSSTDESEKYETSFATNGTKGENLQPGNLDESDESILQELQIDLAKLENDLIDLELPEVSKPVTVEDADVVLSTLFDDDVTESGFESEEEEEEEEEGEEDEDWENMASIIDPKVTDLPADESTGNSDEKMQDAYSTTNISYETTTPVLDVDHGKNEAILDKIMMRRVGDKQPKSLRSIRVLVCRVFPQNCVEVGNKSVDWRR